ncbi:dCTP deaminase [Candidatus Dojkabacteria bacterium]|uniref:dCTP deaminase, dUMP-forming n=1 Tax=Candidatus Dojkabacteria bacterium TaxID=2099670 RepID=A0A955L162_9BACT|nr:dCTP deaminase [Candidatus Dojkabacteria bacterium]
MILSDGEIKKMLLSGDLVCRPITDESIQPASIDCRLGDHFLVVDDAHMESISLGEEIKYREIKTKSITIPPHSFLLGTTMEYVELPDNLIAFVEGRSSIGRMGLFIQNAGWVDPGFKGKITLKLYNANSLPIKLEAGRRICQFVFGRMGFKAEVPYGAPGKKSKYQGQMDAVGSRVFKDVENDSKE